MNRPSHWMLAAVVSAVVALVATGRLSAWLDAAPSEMAVVPAVASAERSGADLRAAALRRPGRALQAPAVHRLRGVVVDRLGWPVENAQVIGRGPQSALTDSSGQFEFRWTGPLVGALRIEAPGRHAPAEVLPSIDRMFVVLQDAVPWQAVAAAEPTGVDTTLFGEGLLRSADGARHPGGRVRVPENGSLAIADDTGRFVLPLHSGSQSLIAWDPSGLVATLPPLEPTRAEGKVPLPDVVLRPGLQVRGRVIDPDGEPLAGVSVQVDNGGSERIGQTDAAGMFRISGLAAVRTAVTIVPTRGLLGTRRSRLLDGDLGRGDWELGDLALERPQSLRLRVVDSTDRPQPWVHVVADQDDGLSRAYAQADDSGHVSLGSLGSGSVAFEVRSSDLAPLAIQAFDVASATLVVSR